MSHRRRPNMQPYEYDRFAPHQGQPSRDRDPHRGIEYQDDSLSSVNSDEEGYLNQRNNRQGDQKKNFYSSKPAPNNQNMSKPIKIDKPPPSDNYHKKEVKIEPPPQETTADRLSRVETLLEQFIKRSLGPAGPSVEKPADKPVGRYHLEPRRHDFTTSMWITNIQEVSVQNNFNEAETIHYMESQMSGIIKTWYKSLPNYDFTWPEWKLLITKTFPDNIDFVTTLKRLVTRLKQADETTTNYYYSKMYLIEACKITGEDAVSCLIDGLNNQTIQEQAKAQNYLTPETLFSQFLTTLPDYSVDYSPLSNTATEAALNTWYHPGPGAQEIISTVPEPSYPKDTGDDYIGFEQQQHSSYEQADMDPNSVQFEPPPNRKRPGPVHARLDKRFIKAPTFNKPNTPSFKPQNSTFKPSPTFKPNNPNFKPSPKMPLAAKFCNNCGKRGHLSNICRKPKTKAMMNYCQLESRQGGFTKTCLINGCSFESLIDTGCSTVTITSKACRKMGLDVVLTSEVIRCFGGFEVDTLGEVEVDVEVDLAKARVRAVVVPDWVQQDFPVIVGQGFLCEKNVALIMKNEMLTIFQV